MKKNIFKLLLFIAPLAIVFFIIEYKLNKISTSYNIKKNGLKKNEKVINTIVLGSSHGLFGINPAEFSKPTFNLANASQSIYFDKEIILQQINNLPNLKNVILPISYFDFYYDMKDGIEKNRISSYKYYWNINNNEHHYLNLSNYSLIAMLTPQTTLEIASKGFKKMNNETKFTVDATGFIAKDSIGSESRISDELGKKRSHYHTSILKESNIALNIKYMQEMLSVLQQKHINTYIITTPVYTTYSKYLDTVILKKNDSIINTLCHQFNCTYNNFSNDSRFTKQYFYDSDHLNKYGANKFSKILDSLLEHHN